MGTAEGAYGWFVPDTFDVCNPSCEPEIHDLRSNDVCGWKSVLFSDEEPDTLDTGMYLCRTCHMTYLRQCYKTFRNMGAIESAECVFDSGSPANRIRVDLSKDARRLRQDLFNMNAHLSFIQD